MLQNLYGSIIIPQGVYGEVTALGIKDSCSVVVQTFPWIQTTQISNPAISAIFTNKLGLGETEAIAESEKPGFLKNRVF
ncbi:MAG: hypothetical protein SAK29_35390 [Scytonema sp. PMC 1069.18]|nr:hypothetical protein [Scytonema sp. PMC 1069.18]MEC4880972.1 hypothetical protein [Scytonema sp. PMC 1070.18]